MKEVNWRKIHLTMESVGNMAAFSFGEVSIAEGGIGIDITLLVENISIVLPSIYKE